MTAETLLPLFPLGVVLFPGARIPLHVFEERYRLLIAGCLEAGGEFGMHLAREGRLAGVGCTARVAEVVKRYDDGRMDIVAEGVRRYRLRRLVSGRKPYALGVVEYLSEAPGRADPALVAETLRLLRELLAVLPGAGPESVPEADPGGEVSYRLAPRAALDLEDRQRLLELPSEGERMRFLNAHLRDVVPKIRRAEEIERLARNDGYL
ncbi:MAG: LON peptidase substrate-binding domain-containing protein [Bacteroidota bacterium]